MEQRDTSRRQFEAYEAQQSQQQTSDDVADHYTDQASAEPSRQQSFLQPSPTSATPGPRNGGDAQSMYGYAQYGAAPSLQPAAMQYVQDLQMAGQQRLQQQQQQQQQSQHSPYAQYGSDVMYGMSQPQPAQPIPSPYEQVQHFRQRTGAAPETLPIQFGVAQPGQYYLAGPAGGPASVAASNLSAVPPIPSQYQPTGNNPQSSFQAQQPYPSTMLDAVASGAYPAYNHPPPYSAPPPAAESVDQAFNDYQNRIRRIFTFVRDGVLRDCDAQLLHISQYLLGNAEALGLARDDEALRNDRIRLWDEFNRAWLTTLQRQYDLTQEVLQTNQALREPRSIMSAQTLEHLSRELVRMCDGVERHGLVDYQMGVAEGQIMDLLLKCLALLEPPSDRASNSNEQADPPTDAAPAASGQR